MNTNKTRWEDEDTYWRSAYRTRPYAMTDSNYDTYQPGYRFGYEAANRYPGKSWNEVEPELSSSWNAYEYRGTSTWQQMKDAVRDAWDRVTGHHAVGAHH